ncbi:flavodoxin family protein [Lacicoccus qingdaonensis]|uniref:Multimeric flavodoxin WrbA n=1 Tax=Lacicoccus qingdaonensis TaxID=576118 RepID=A0A1G9J4Z0_9BACL|nr:flavodoxin family protein [Salinicoccus qingdaonensis]SDL32392.1 Multimeric flavodoxin WrbA [Salinicoccus qingdaonensis]
MALRALFLNTTLKYGDEKSNTEALADEVFDIYRENGVETESVRITDYNVLFGISDDLGGGDEFPQILKKVEAADIVIIGTPIWLGEKSSVAKLLIERLYGSASLTNDKGQSIFYNKVGGVVVTGNEDGGKAAAKSILYSMAHNGFTIPPNVNTYWVGDAGPGPSYMEAGTDNEFTKSHVKMLAWNTMHLARLFKEHPIPAEGNTME